jgi:hypothetical protein
MFGVEGEGEGEATGAKLLDRLSTTDRLDSLLARIPTPSGMGSFLARIPGADSLTAVLTPLKSAEELLDADIEEPVICETSNNKSSDSAQANALYAGDPIQFRWLDWNNDSVKKVVQAFNTAVTGLQARFYDDQYEKRVELEGDVA